MVARILLVCADDPRRRQLEDLLADQRTTVRRLDVVGRDLAWSSGPAPDLLVVGAFGRTAHAVEVVRTALAAEPTLSALAVDDPSSWPEALLHLPGVAVVPFEARGGFAAARARLLERRALLRQVATRRDEPLDRLAAEALQGDQPAVREMRLMLARAEDRSAHIVLAGEPGTLRTRILRHVLRTLGDLGADSDTLLVEDIDLADSSRQAAFLRFAQAGRRLVATATAEFRVRARDGRFRDDLYYRLGGHPVDTVPLRERRQDVARLALAAGLAVESEAALALLATYDWPGNLRELELVCQHAGLLSRGGPVDERHVALPEVAGARLPSGRFVLRIPESGVSLEEIEKEAIRQALIATDSNVAETARRLSVERGKLRYRLRKFGLGR